MKALERPTHSFFQKEASKKPKEVDRYAQWLKTEDSSLIEYIKGEAESCAERKATGLPFKKPNLKSGYERRLFEENMQAVEAYIEMSASAFDTSEAHSPDEAREMAEIAERYS